MVEETQEKEEEQSEWSKRLDRGDKQLEEMHKANEDARKILEEQKELATRNLLGGKTQAGEQPEEVKEETAKEYAERVVTGGLNDKRT